MKRVTFRYLLPVSIVFSGVLAACSSGGHSAFLPSVDNPDGGRTAPKTPNAFVYVTIPQQITSMRRKRVRKHYVSPATQSIAIAIALPSGRTKQVNANLTTATNKNCKPSAAGIVCQLPLRLAAGTYTA